MSEANLAEKAAATPAAGGAPAAEEKESRRTFNYALVKVNYLNE